MHRHRRASGSFPSFGSARRIRLPVVVGAPLALVALLLAVSATFAAAGASAASDARVKLLIDAADAVALAQLKQAGATLLVDYGGFSLWRAPLEVKSALANRSGVSAPDDFLSEARIGLRRGQFIDTRAGASPPAVSPLLHQQRSAGAQFWMVQFVGPVKGEWLDALQQLGLEVVSYMASNAYVVWGDAGALADLDAWASKHPAVQWTGAFHPAYRLESSLHGPALAGAPDVLADVTVQFHSTRETESSLRWLTGIAGEVLVPANRILNYTNISLRVPAGRLIEIANRTDVVNVEPYVAPHRMDEVQGQIVAGTVISIGGRVIPDPIGTAYLPWLASKGFSTTAAAYPIVDIVDDGIDQGAADAVLHPDFYAFGSTANPDRISYLVNCYNNIAPRGIAGHGNINAGIMGGYNDTSNWRSYGLGISPYGRIAGTKIFSDTGVYGVAYCGGTDQGVVLSSFNHGANFTSNSWGADVYGAYNASAQAYDVLTRDANLALGGNQQMLHVFSAGNKGPNANTIGSPGTAKNVLTVGATENVRGNGILDGCNESAADSADDIAGFSAHGPTDDGRVKPDIMAPGTHVQGPASQDLEYDGTGVCGGSPYPTKYYPPFQTLYTWSSGTSHSAPAVAGAASLAWEYYGRVLNPGNTPSPAMLKALLLNSTRYLNGYGTGGTLPSDAQGWGDVNLGTLSNGAPRILRDQHSADVLTATGQIRLFTGKVVTSTRPFRVTLAWTDAPGPAFGNAFVNDLNLEVTVGGVIYKGNVFSGASSTGGGAFDPRNNVESVFLPAGVGGPFAVKVVAANIVGDGVPNVGGALDQDFALVITNGEISLPMPMLSVAQVSARDANGDGAFDLGEPFTLAVGLNNTGVTTAVAVSASISSAGGALVPISPAASYPNIAVGGMATNTTPFSFLVNPQHVCGEPLVLSYTATYAGNGLFSSSATFVYSTGVPGLTEQQNFDGVAPPALPAGWTTAITGFTRAWSTVITQSSSAPNSVFAPDPGGFSTNDLLSPPFPISTPNALLVFRHAYDLEYAFDGTVLDISIGAGPFQDILAAGGVFLSGPYNAPISQFGGSAIAGRQAWTNDSGGFITTTVKLPPATLGQNVQLRWRLATDAIGSRVGHYIDSVTVFGTPACASWQAQYLPVLLR